MKLAITHDTYLHQGGAEKVLYSLIELNPTADIYIPLIRSEFKKNISQKTKGKVHTSLLNYLPCNHLYSSLLKPLIYVYWKTLNLDRYDLVISSSHSFSAKSINTTADTKHISYIHTPPRYLHGISNENKWIHHKMIFPIIKPILSFFKKRDIIDAQKPDLLIANSINVKKRIKKIYKRDSIVIYPPINVPKRIDHISEEYYVFLGRLVKQKGAELAVKAFNKLNKKLIVIGTGKEKQYLKGIAGQSIEFVDFVTEKQKNIILKKAKAMINCSIEEDFGIAPIEAMAQGTPVIAYRSGGVEETIIPGKNGLFFEKHSVLSLIKTIQKFEQMKFDSNKCHQLAKKYDSKKFDKKISSVVSKYLS